MLYLLAIVASYLAGVYTSERFKSWRAAAVARLRVWTSAEAARAEQALKDEAKRLKDKLP